MSQIQIACDTPDSEIYYSIDNENLDVRYNGPFEINQTSTIKAIGKKDGFIDSGIAEYFYEKLVLPQPEFALIREDGSHRSLVLINSDQYPDNSIIEYTNPLYNGSETIDNSSPNWALLVHLALIDVADTTLSYTITCERYESISGEYLFPL